MGPWNDVNMHAESDKASIWVTLALSKTTILIHYIKTYAERMTFSER